METEIHVCVDIAGTSYLAGRLWARERRGLESASFEYDPSWLKFTNRFSLEPTFMLGAGPFHTPSGKTMFSAIGDSAPDLWGRILMRRAERRRTQSAGETPHTLMEIDYLLMVDDEARPTIYTQIELDKTETRVYAMFHVSGTVHTSHTETAGEFAAADIGVGPRAVQQPFCGGPSGVPGVWVC